MRRDGYDAYHGRNRFGTFLKVLIIVLLILLVAAVAALFFLEPYIVYSSDGVRLNLPFFQEKEDPAPDTSAPAVVVSTPEATTTMAPIMVTSQAGRMPVIRPRMTTIKMP